MTATTFRLAMLTVAVVLTGLTACEGTDGATDDGRLPDLIWPDTAVDYGTADPGLDDPGTPGDAHEDGGDTAEDPGDQDAGSEDPGSTDPGPGDPGVSDPGPEDPGPPPPTFCRSFAECEPDEVCVLSLGECQTRSTWTETATGLYGIHPRELAVGDVLIIDGKRFDRGSSSSLPSARIGTTNFGSSMIQYDENRILIPITQAASGELRVWTYYNGTVTMVWDDVIAAAPTGVVPCDDQTPPATYEPGVRPDMTGPYGAAYVDLGDATKTRVYYPAQCGSVRRPPIESEAAWPLVCILHGNGALHLQYEYLAELLASWGFVSFMPQTQQNMAGEDFRPMLEELMPVITKMRGQDLDALHPALAGVRTTPEIAFIGHSRGTGRAEEAIGADDDLKAHAVGFVFLGPVDDDQEVPGHFIVFGGGKDAQSRPSNYNGTYDNQDPPRYKVVLPGGNHGSFCDHQVYGYVPLGPLVGDNEPTIPRSLQLQIVQRFTLPLLQRAFGLDEPFAEVLDAAPDTADYAVTRDAD
jgi:dienelactone hydrolase